jgi:hypothetical protein
MRALTPALQEGGEALYRACEAINRKAVCPLVRQRPLRLWGLPRLPRRRRGCIVQAALCAVGHGRKHRDGNPRTAAERQEFRGRGRQGRSDTKDQARSGEFKTREGRFPNGRRRLRLRARLRVAPDRAQRGTPKLRFLVNNTSELLKAVSVATISNTYLIIIGFRACFGFTFST